MTEQISGIERLFPEMLWDGVADPKTLAGWARRFFTLEYCLNDAGPNRFNRPDVTESAHRAIANLIEAAPAEFSELRRVQAYMMERVEVALALPGEPAI